MNVTVVQSYRFPNCWTVQPIGVEANSAEEAEIYRIFTDRFAHDGSWACQNAIDYCKKNGYAIKSYKVQHQFSDLDYHFDDDVEKIVLNEGKPAYYNGQPVA